MELPHRNYQQTTGRRILLLSGAVVTTHMIGDPLYTYVCAQQSLENVL